jgi:polysaccharide biosynthesis transport protein
MSDILPYPEGPRPEPLHLRDYWHVVLRRRWLALAVFLLVAGAAVARVVLVRPVYQAHSQILIERDVPKVVDFDEKARADDAWQDYYQTQYRLLQSRLLARRVVERLHLLQDAEFQGPRSEAELKAAEEAAPGASPVMEQAIDRFLERLTVRPVKNSQLVAVAYQADRPALAAQVANALPEVYIQQTLDFRYRISAEAGAWLARENQEQSRKLEAAELALQKFSEHEGLVNVEERRSLVEQKLKDLGSSLTAARTRRLEKEALYLQMQRTGNPEELPEVIRSPLIQTLRTELATLERQGAQLQAKGYLEQHPEAVKVREQVEGTRQKIAGEARRIVRAAQNDFLVAADQERRVGGALEGAKDEALDLEKRALKYDALKRDLDASQRVSDSLVVRQKQTDVVRDVRASNVHVIDAAVIPTVPVRPRPVRDVGLGVMLGLALALAAAFLRDYLDTSVGKPGDVRLMGLPLLGVIAEAPDRRRPLVVARSARPDPFAEGYRVLRTALPLPPEVGDAQVLLVTSTLPGEGKSLTSVNLALTLASTEERVLLIDTDLRRPSLHTLLNARRVPGLSEVLIGMSPAADAIHRVPGSRLALLPAGTPLQRNPADLLATHALRKLLAELRGRYDRIVLDTPPVGAIADALILAPQAEGVLVVAHSGKVTRSALTHVLERLANAGGRVLGVVLNRARPDRHAYDYGPGFARDAFVVQGRRALRPAPEGPDHARAERSPGRPS